MTATLTPLLIFLLLGASFTALWMWIHWRRLARAQFIRSYEFPAGLLDRLAAKRPGLADKDRYLAMRALRKFFLAYLNGGLKPVAMPSQVVDDLWHEFILYTRHYRAFCKQAFGRFLHYTPAVVLSADRRTNAGLWRARRGLRRRLGPDELHLVLGHQPSTHLPNHSIHPGGA